MAKQHRPEPVDLQRDRHRQTSQLITLVAGQQPPDLQVVLIGGGVGGVVEAGDQAALAVAVDPDGVLAELGEPVERLAGQWSTGDVAVEHEPVDSEPVDLGQHRFQGRQVAVDVGQHGDAHGGSWSLWLRI
jgi:hypothetical protein